MSTLANPVVNRQVSEPELIDTAAAAGLLALSEKTAARLPVPGRVTLGRSVRHVRSEVIAWIEAGCPR